LRELPTRWWDYLTAPIVALAAWLLRCPVGRWISSRHHLPLQVPALQVPPLQILPLQILPL